MIAIKLSVEDIRCIKAAELKEELEGVKALILERLEQAETMAAFKKSVTPKIQQQTGLRSAAYQWKEALATAREVLGSMGVTVPPYPLKEWYSRLNAHMRQYGIGEEEVRKLAEYVKANMKLPIKLDFMIRQHERILAGEWAAPQITHFAPTRINIMANKLPDD